jgi:hypothetical protein
MVKNLEDVQAAGATKEKLFDSQPVFNPCPADPKPAKIAAPWLGFLGFPHDFRAGIKQRSLPL